MRRYLVDQGDNNEKSALAISSPASGSLLSFFHRLWNVSDLLACMLRLDLRRRDSRLNNYAIRGFSFYLYLSVSVDVCLTIAFNLTVLLSSTTHKISYARYLRSTDAFFSGLSSLVSVTEATALPTCICTLQTCSAEIGSSSSKRCAQACRYLELERLRAIMYRAEVE